MQESVEKMNSSEKVVVHVPNSLQQAKSPLMRLPVELRLIIAEYALTYEDGIFWFWDKYRKRGKFMLRTDYSSFDDAKDLNPLKLVCTTLYWETRNSLYKLNTLRFNPGMTYPRPSFKPYLEVSINDWHFFLNQARKREIDKDIRRVDLFTAYECHQSGLTPLFKQKQSKSHRMTARAISKEHLDITFKLYICEWHGTFQYRR